jgi:hypothetical protein
MKDQSYFDDLNKFRADLAQLKADALAQRSAILKYGDALEADRLCLEACQIGLDRLSATLANQQAGIEETKSLLSEARLSAQESEDALRES